ncbi:hypothetical protein ACROYT_G014485 [Oculina patagonica]
MSAFHKAEFEKWYTDLVAEDYQFNFNWELLAYCQSDVKLLPEGCEVFWEEFQAVAGFDPMEQCLNITAACNQVKPGRFSYTKLKFGAPYGWLA